MSPLELPSGSNFDVEPKTRCEPSAESDLPTKPACAAPGPGSSEPFMPWTKTPLDIRTGIPVEPSPKQGAQIPAPPKANAERSTAEPATGEPNGFVAGVPSEGRPT